jgi:hypothetical protein
MNFAARRTSGVGSSMSGSSEGSGGGLIVRVISATVLRDFGDWGLLAVFG